MEGISVMTQLFARGAKVPKQGFFVPMEQKTKIDGVVVHNFRNERIAVECDGGVLSVAVKTSASTAQEWSEAHSRPTDLPRGSDRSNRVSFRVVRRSPPESLPEETAFRVVYEANGFWLYPVLGRRRRASELVH